MAATTVLRPADVLAHLRIEEEKRDEAARAFVDTVIAPDLSAAGSFIVQDGLVTFYRCYSITAGVSSLHVKRNVILVLRSVDADYESTVTIKQGEGDYNDTLTVLLQQRL
jgi:hypothetical protein